jgi:hypothetical protein
MKILVAAAAVLAAVPAVAAHPDRPETAARVRLALRTPDGKRLSGRIVGQLVASGPDTLTVSVGPGREAVVKRADVWRMEHSAGKRSRGAGALRGAAIGLGVGVVLGAGVGALSGDDRERVVYCPPYHGFGFGPLCGPLFTFSARDKAIIGGIGLGSLGAVLGGIGGAAAPGERWRRAHGVRDVALELQPAGLGARLALRF